MTKLDLVLARIRQLPPEQQEAFAEQIEYALDHQGAGSLLTDEEWAEIEPTLDDDQEVIWRARALADLEAALAYIAKDSSSGAQSTRERILDSVALLEQWPDAGRVGRRPGLREQPVPRTPFLIIYRHRAAKLFILRIWHTSRNR
jgi:toxin ParE1/3/4